MHLNVEQLFEIMEKGFRLWNKKKKKKKIMNLK